MTERDKDTHNFLWGVRYFHEEKGDMTRLIGFDERRLRDAAPLVHAAYIQYQLALLALNHAVKTLPEETL